jgi:hypothetical protein
VQSLADTFNVFTPRRFKSQLDFGFTDDGLTEAASLIDIQNIRAQCCEALRELG